MGIALICHPNNPVPIGYKQHTRSDEPRKSVGASVGNRAEGETVGTNDTLGMSRHSKEHGWN